MKFKALLQFDYTFPDTPEEDKRLNDLKEISHCNMALSKYFLKDFNECLIHCGQALKLNPKNLKALYRKACIYFERDLFEETKQVSY